MRRGLIAGGLLMAAALVASGRALAQEDGAASSQTPGLALGRFNPAPAGDRFFGVPSPYVAGDPALHVMLLGDYAHNPLVLVREGAEDTELGSVVSSQLFLH